MVLSEKVIHLLEPVKKITKLTCSEKATTETLYDTC